MPRGGVLQSPSRPGRHVIGTEILIILALVLLNGLFAGAEIAVITVRETRLKELLEAGRGSARALAALRNNPERFLATVQIGITVVGATAAAFGGATVAARLAPVIARIPALERSSEELALTLVVVTVSYLSLVIGELVPKSLALRAAEPYALAISRPLHWMGIVASPLVWFLTASSNVVLRVFGDSTSFTESRMSADELADLVEQAGEHGSVHPDASAIASRALVFGELTASDMMIPRRDVVALPLTATPDEIRQVLLERRHSRIPVYADSIDACIGYVTHKELAAKMLQGQQPDLKAVMREPWFVPESVRATDLLEQMRGTQRHLALVVDETGGLAGIVTLEDVLEELVGEIFSESQVASVHFRREGRTVIAKGDTPIRELNWELDLELPEGDDWSTVGGLAVSRLGRIPAAGERIPLEDGVELEIMESTARRVQLVRVHLPEEEPLQD